MAAKIIVFGGYDTRKPRVRLLIEALRRQGALAQEIHVSGWEDVPQTNIPSKTAFLKVLAKLLLGYPRALWRLLRSAKGTAVLLPYPGVIEIYLIGPLARMLGRTVVLDAFLPIYDTIAVDRGLVKTGGVLAKLIWQFERMGLRLADIVLVDTDSHGDYFAREFGLDRDRFETVLVGAENHFAPSAQNDPVEDLLGPRDDRPIILFYGQLIPLHGVPTIIEAAKRARTMGARWVIIGRGQLEPVMRQTIQSDDGSAIEWIEWVEYDRLPSVIARADICLGVFSASDKAARVIPNKLFQQLAVGKTVITRASPAVDTLASDFPAALRTVPADDPDALAMAVEAALANRSALAPLPEESLKALSPDAGAARLMKRLEAGA
ncbi:glycosyltransferase family 4 protein [Erythrobacter insulae]|uniref:Glycosyltransferase family 4 protein n=1 Tax=Erythrobacter insulae TaxID=2584124 RepID=A0A547P914_9SPHN|nr:glycosyltransferase [Erythrobacter insulae]TRD10603.1 glycosyltransferase family 4 protein [Erythrobacter insulae]